MLTPIEHKLSDQQRKTIDKYASKYATQTLGKFPRADRFTRALIFCEAASIAADGGNMVRADHCLDMASTLSRHGTMTDNERDMLRIALFHTIEFRNYCDATFPRA